MSNAALPAAPKSESEEIESLRGRRTTRMGAGRRARCNRIRKVDQQRTPSTARCTNHRANTHARAHALVLLCARGRCCFLRTAGLSREICRGLCDITHHMCGIGEGIHLSIFCMDPVAERIVYTSHACTLSVNDLWRCECVRWSARRGCGLK